MAIVRGSEEDMSVSKWGYSPSKCDGSPCVGDCDKCSKANEPDLDDLYKELEEKISEVNVNTIADNLNHELLWNWCGAWREETIEIIKEIKAYGRRRD